MQRKAPPTAIAALTLVAALIALLVYGVVSGGADNSFDDAVSEGKRLPAPARNGKRLDAPGQLSIADYRGKIVVLNFWASWCKPCRVEAPALERAHRKYGNRGVVVLGADVDDVTADALAFKRKYGLTYPLFRYSNDDASRDFGTKLLPEVFLIDRRGRVAALHRGQTDDAWLNREIPKLLNEAADAGASGAS